MTFFLDFRLKSITFDSMPWVVTMKKNEHYFPTMEWIKDANDPVGWRRVTYDGGKKIAGEGRDGIHQPADDQAETDDDGAMAGAGAGAGAAGSSAAASGTVAAGG